MDKKTKYTRSLAPGDIINTWAAPKVEGQRGYASADGKYLSGPIRITEVGDGINWNHFNGVHIETGTPVTFREHITVNHDLLDPADYQEGPESRTDHFETGQVEGK